MTEFNELRKIKKKYGENFMKLCRELFPTILEEEGLLYKILTSSFSDNSRTLYSDIVNNNLEDVFKGYVYSKIDVKKDEPTGITETDERTPYEIFKEIGYDLTECTTEEQIQRFKKYYAKGEELCTFKGDRLNRCVVFWAVKKDAEDIKREDFDKPRREDEYGTSVMSIQFEKQGLCTVSIKNRYNHFVNNPDATYGNNLDRIAPGLEQSFERLLKERGLSFDNSNIESFKIPGYVVANDGKYYKYNQEINGVYYCPGNIVIEGGEVKKIENPESYILMDYFMLDLKNKRIYTYDNTVEDSFVDGFQNIEKIEIRKNPETKNKTRIITILVKDQDEPIIIEINNDNQIIRYENSVLEQCGNNFLKYNTAMSKLILPKLTECGDDFLRDNNKDNGDELMLNCNSDGLTELYLPSLKKCGNNFLKSNTELAKLVLPKLEQCGDNFLLWNAVLRKLELPMLKQCGDNFLLYNTKISDLYVPKLEKYGNGFLKYNKNKIHSSDIARLDKDNEITTSEINYAGRIIESCVKREEQK